MDSRTRTAEEVVERLGLIPHPEGGHYIETYRDFAEDGGRGACSSIYYLLAAGEHSAWHRVTDAAEIWHWYAGAPLALTTAGPDGPAKTIMLGNDLESGQVPQAAVRAGDWQTAVSQGAWTLVGCTVAPAFEFQYWELAPAGWSPPET